MTYIIASRSYKDAAAFRYCSYKRYREVNEEMQEGRRQEEYDELHEDPLRIARGIAWGIAIGGAMWAAVIGLFVMWVMK